MTNLITKEIENIDCYRSIDVWKLFRHHLNGQKTTVDYFSKFPYEFLEEVFYLVNKRFDINRTINPGILKKIKEDKFDSAFRYLRANPDLMQSAWLIRFVKQYQEEADYDAVMNYIEAVYGILSKQDGIENILDVAAGRLAVTSAALSNLGYKVTAIDPRTMDLKYLKEHGVTVMQKKLIPEEYSEYSGQDVFLAKRPCDATENMIKSAEGLGKGFLARLCDCVVTDRNITIGYGCVDEKARLYVDSLKHQNGGIIKTERGIYINNMGYTSL